MILAQMPMSDDSCSIPQNPSDDEAAPMVQMLAATRIAVVGASEDPSRASNRIAEFLLEHGKDVIPVNPNYPTVLGLNCYPSLRDVPGPIEVVNVFRRGEFCESVARDAIEIGAKGIWLQSGIHCEEARKLARGAGLLFVEDRCIMVEFMRRGA